MATESPSEPLAVVAGSGGSPRNDGNSPSRAQNDGNSPSCAQNDGNSPSRAQNDGNSPSRAQNDGNSPFRAQNDGNSPSPTGNDEDVSQRSEQDGSFSYVNSTLSGPNVGLARTVNIHMHNGGTRPEVRKSFEELQLRVMTLESEKEGPKAALTEALQAIKSLREENERLKSELETMRDSELNRRDLHRQSTLRRTYEQLRRRISSLEGNARNRTAHGTTKVVIAARPLLVVDAMRSSGVDAFKQSPVLPDNATLGAVLPVVAAEMGLAPSRVRLERYEGWTRPGRTVFLVCNSASDRSEFPFTFADRYGAVYFVDEVWGLRFRALDDHTEAVPLPRGLRCVLHAMKAQ